MRTTLPVDLEMLSYDEEKSQISTATSITTDSDESNTTNRLKTGPTYNNNIFSNAVHHLIFDSLKNGIRHLSDNLKGSLLRISNKSEQPNSDGEALIDSQIGDDMAKKMNWSEALRAWKKSLGVFQQSVNAADRRMAAILLNKIGIAYYIQDSLYFSHESFQQALTIQEANLLDPGHEEITLTLKNIWIVRVRMMEKTHHSLVRELLMLHMMNNLCVRLLMRTE